MARSKVPSDPNMTPEVRRYLDGLSKEISEALESIETLLPAYASEAEAEAGTSETVLMNPLRTAQAIAAQSPFSNNYLHVRDERSSGTDGGNFANGAWRTRTLNTVTTNTISGASLASNTVTLPAGRYLIMAWGVGNAVGIHQARLWNVTGSAVVILGTTERSQNATNATTRSTVSGEFTLSATTDLTLEHRCATTNATGFGLASSWGVEVYADFIVWKLD